MSYKSILFISILVLLMHSCARIKINESLYPRIYEHKVIALAPVKVTNTNNTMFMPGLHRGQRTASIQFHKGNYEWLTENTDRSKYWFNLLPLFGTVNTLRQNGFYDEKSLTASEICDILGADGLIMVSYVLDRGLSETGRDIERFGDYSPSKNSTALIEIFDRKHKKVLWSYYHRFSPGLERSDRAFIDDMFAKIIDKLPYFIGAENSN